MTESETSSVAAECPVEMHEGKPCGRPAYRDSARCICHYPVSDRDRDAFSEEIRAMLARKDYDFTRFLFWDDADLHNITFDGAAHFCHTRFYGEARFWHTTFQSDASFLYAMFNRDAEFDRATFETDANFNHAIFCAEARFWEATFGAEAQFWGTEFQGEADFESATLRGEGQFLGAKFKGEASFSRTAFEDEVQFGGAEFEVGADFADAALQASAGFLATRFRQSATFVGAGGNRVFSSTEDTDFDGAILDRPRDVVFQHVFLGRARFLHTDVRFVDFTDVEWARRPFWGAKWQLFLEPNDGTRRLVRWLCRRWPPCLRPRGRFAVWDELASEGKSGDDDHALIGKLYRQLKHNYEEQRDPITAGDFHFGEMHMRRLANSPTNRFLRFLKRNLSFLALYRWISGYGEDYILPLAWIVCVIAAFAAAFSYIPALALQPSPTSNASQPINGLWPHMLYSIMCFLLRGDRPFQPTHLGGHYLSVAEGVLGPPLVALFVLALNRRFKR